MYTGNPTQMQYTALALIFTQILEGIEFLHSIDVIHRDIRPSNVMISKEGAVKLRGFKFSTKTHLVDDSVGNVYYMSPERAKEEIINSKLIFGPLV